jgi:hypothetical protein
MGLADALRAAGFAGVEIAENRLYARAEGPDSPEFLAEETPSGWRFSLTHPVRASQAALADWNARHPDAPIDVETGETRLTMLLPAAPRREDLILWAGLAERFVQSALVWRRTRRAAGEGM